MKYKHAQYEDEEFEAHLREHFSHIRARIDIPREPLEKAFKASMPIPAISATRRIASPYGRLFSDSRKTQHFALSFAVLLLVAGVSVGALQSELFLNNVNMVKQNIPRVSEALAPHLTERLNAKEQAEDDEDFSAPEMDNDPALSAFDVYGEISS